MEAKYKSNKKKVLSINETATGAFEWYADQDNIKNTKENEIC